MSKVIKLKSAIIPKKAKPFDGIIFSIRRVKMRDLDLFIMKMKVKRAKYFRFKLKRKGFRIYTVLMAYK